MLRCARPDEPRRIPAISGGQRSSLAATGNGPDPRPRRTDSSRLGAAVPPDGHPGRSGPHRRQADAAVLFRTARFRRRAGHLVCPGKHPSGARALLNTVKRSTDPDVQHATAYLSHGAGHNFWQSFLAVLDSHSATLHEQSAIDGAVRAYELFERATGRVPGVAVRKFAELSACSELRIKGVPALPARPPRHKAQGGRSSPPRGLP